MIYVKNIIATLGDLMEEDSWKTILGRQGFTVEPVLAGLGSNDEFARIFVSHIRDAARDHGIPLE